MQVLLEATKTDSDDNHRIQKKAKTKATSTKSVSTKDSAEMNDTKKKKKKKEKEKITSGGAIEEVEQPRGRQEISGVEKLAPDALNNILPNERTVNNTANKVANEQAKAGQKVRQDKKQNEEQEKSDKNLVALGRDYSRLLQVKRNNLKKKQPEKQKENVIVDNTDVSTDEVFLHKTYKEALQRMRRENVRKVRDHKQPLSKNNDAALDAVARAKDKMQRKDLAPTADAIAAAEAAKRETSLQRAALAYQLKQLQQLQQLQLQTQQIQQIQRQQLSSSYLSQIQSQAALLPPLLMGGGQGAIPGFGGMEVNQIFQNLLGQNNVNMNAANCFQKFNWDSNQGGDIGKSGANLSVPPSEDNNRSSSKMMNSSPKRKRAGNSSSMLAPSVNAVALKRNIGFIIDEQVKTIRKKIALKFELSEAAAEKELNLLENRNALHAALCSLFELSHRE